MEDGGDGSDVPLADRVAALHGPGQEQDLLLDVGRQVEEVHDLGDAGPGHVTQPGEIRVVPHLPAADDAVELDGQSHEARDPRDVARLDTPRTNARAILAFPTVVSGLEGPPDLDGTGEGARLITPHARLHRPCWLRCRAP